MLTDFLSGKPKLTAEAQTQIYNIVKNVFSDILYFNTLVSDGLKLLLKDSNEIEISVIATKHHLSNYFNEDLISYYTPELAKQLKDQILLILKTGCVLVLYFQKNSYIESIKWMGVSTLLTNYPQFQGLPEEELKYLLTFRNVLKVALIIIPATSHKQLLLKIAGRLEGSATEYITGGGQKAAVTRRVIIYETEGNVKASTKQAKVTSKKRQMDSFETFKAHFDQSNKLLCTKPLDTSSTESDSLQTSSITSDPGEYVPSNQNVIDDAVADAVEVLQSLARCSDM